MEGCEQQWDISIHPAFGKKQRHEEGFSHLTLFFRLHPVAFVWLFAETLQSQHSGDLPSQPITCWKPWVLRSNANHICACGQTPMF